MKIEYNVTYALTINESPIKCQNSVKKVSKAVKRKPEGPEKKNT